MASLSLPTLDKVRLKALKSDERAPFILDWLNDLNRAINPSLRTEVKAAEESLLKQLTELVPDCTSPSVREHTAEAMAAVVGVSGGLRLAATVNALVDTVRVKDEGSEAVLLARRASAHVVGALCRRLGRAMGLHSQDVLQALTRAARANDWRLRLWALRALADAVSGFGAGVRAFTRDVNKCIKTGLADKVEPVRAAAARAATEMVAATTLLQTTELESMFAACVKGLDGAEYNTRVALTATAGRLLSASLEPDAWKGIKASKVVSQADVLSLMSSAYVRNSSRHVRVGVTQILVAFFAHRGATWVERNVALVIETMLGIFTTKTTNTAAEALYTRKCAGFVLVTCLGRRMGEKGRLDAVRTLAKVAKRHMEAVTRGDGNNDKMDHSHAIACTLETMAELVTIIGSPTLALLEVIEPLLFSCSLHPARTVRLAAARCLRCVSLQVPAKAFAIATTGIDRVHKLKGSPDALQGAAVVTAAVLAGSASSVIGLPQALSARVFDAGRKLVQSAPQAAKESFAAGLAHVEAGWALLGGLVAMGPAAVESRMLELFSMWTGVLSRSADPPKAKSKAAEPWRLLLQSRLGALETLQSFLIDCQSLVTDEVQRQVVSVLVAALEALESVPKGNKLATRIYNTVLHFRAHLFEAFSAIPLRLYEQQLPQLLPHVVAAFTLTENSALTATTSLLREQCHEEDGVLMGAQGHDSDARSVEAQLETHGGCGLAALENRPGAVYSSRPLPAGGALPISVANLDAAVSLFGHLFPYTTSQKHRAQLLEHLLTCVRASKAGARRQAVQINIFAAFLSALRGIGEIKGRLGKTKVVDAAGELVAAALTNEDTTVRIAAGEAVGRMGQVVGGDFAGQRITTYVKRLQTDPAVVSRTGHALAMGCIHRYVGGMEASRHLGDTVAILAALCADAAAPDVQTWALHALMLAVDSAGLAFSSHVEATLALVTRQVHSEAPPRVMQCAGNVLNAVVTTLGPELAADSTRCARVLVLLTELQNHADPGVCLTGYRGIQQLVLFAPGQVDVPQFVPRLRRTLESPHLLLRRASVSIVRQLVQRRPREIHAHGDGIESLLFEMLDSQEDEGVLFDLREAILALLQALAAEAPSPWLLLCNKVLSGASQRESAGAAQDGGGEGEGEGDTGGSLVAGGEGAGASRVVLPTRWQTKVFAVECVRRVISQCCSAASPSMPHVDLGAARRDGGDMLVLRLGELVRTAYLAATSAIDQLRQAGLDALRDVIERFADTLDADMDGRVPLLEQYMAQITSALRPAFDAETPPHVKTTACHVAAEWVCSGVCASARDLRRVLALLTAGLEGVTGAPDAAFNERATTMLRLAVLQAWARILTCAKEEQDSKPYLTECVAPVRDTLVKHWLDALRDYALVSLPPEYINQVPTSGNFYFSGTCGSVRAHYETAFPTLLRAACMAADLGDDADDKCFYLVVGLASRALCARTERDTATACLRALASALSASTRLKRDPGLAVELCGVFSCAVRTQGTSGQVGTTLLEATEPMLRGFGAVEDQATTPLKPGTSALYAILELITSTLLGVLPNLGGGGKGSISKSETEVKTLSAGDLATVNKAADLLTAATCITHTSHRAAVLPAVVQLLHTTLCALPHEQAGGVLAALGALIKDCCAEAEKEGERGAETTNSTSRSTLLALASSALTTISNPVLGKQQQQQHPVLAWSPNLRLLALLVAQSPICAANSAVASGVCSAITAAMDPHTAPVQLRSVALTVATTVFRRVPGPAGHVYVRAWAPSALEALALAARTAPTSADEAAVLTQCIRLLEALLARAPEAHMLPLLSAIVPVLVANMAGGGGGSSATGSSSPQAVLQAAALQAVLAVGPAHPAAFRATVAAAPQLKTRLEAAIRASKQGGGVGGAPSGGGGAAAAAARASAAPAIQLKMDFSAFKA